MSRHKGSEGSVRLTPGRGRGCGRPNGRVRRVRVVITDYVEAQKNSTRVERCPRGSAPAAACRQQGHRGEAGPSEWMRCGMRGSSRFRMSSRGSGWTGATSRTLTPIVG